jgi:hypothetical protein
VYRGFFLSDLCFVLFNTGCNDAVVACVARECSSISELYLSGVPVTNESISKFKWLVGRDVRVYGKRMKSKKMV